MAVPTSETTNDFKTANPLRVALLCGGISNEREISFSSADEVRPEIEAAGHTVVTIDTGGAEFIEELRACKVDVAFIALHGKGGEDGTIQGLLELMGIPYVGSGVAASAIALDKMRSKLLFEAAGLRTPTAAVLTKKDFYRCFADLPSDDTADKKRQLAKKLIDTFVKEIGLPCVVKPTDDGSSFGISIVRAREDIYQAFATGFEISEELLIEALVEGVEVTVPIIGNDDPQALPIIEIVPVNEFYDYDSKYCEGGSRHIIPARLDPEQLNACEEDAYAAYEIIGCRGMARVDFIVSEKGVPWILEINTIPGMTTTSLLPDSARAAGISTPELYDRLLRWALEDVPLGASLA